MFGVTPRADAENADGEQQQQPAHANGFDSHEDAMGEVTVNRALNAAAQKVNMKRAQDLLNKLKGYEWISVVSELEDALCGIHAKTESKCGCLEKRLF